ncbi:hypothetical protein TrRE_jg1404 [Triparma retinervis]|uniref:60S ribosomal export protein NMD3 OB-fold domain-containing protein n=1 Tax=Triparma retinervis TaxID=2557542 RepID=A0A9W6ZXN8_9STRA|nr:hypothetical protein TrRE_jg1404 [Triparma retinervis]
MKEDSMGADDSQVIARSHIGYLCKAGDVVLGYNLRDTNIVERDDEGGDDLGNQDVVVVRKLYGGVASGERERQRIWRLQRLEVEVKETRNAKKEEEKAMEDEEDFMQELEGDKAMRERVNLYKAKEQLGGAEEDDNKEDDQKITLDELLDGLDLDEKPDAGDSAGAAGEYEFDEDLQYGGAFMGGIEEGARAEQDGIGFVGRDESAKVKDKEQPKSVEQFGKEFMDKQFKFT